MSSQSKKNKGGSTMMTEVEKTLKLFVQCFCDETAKHFILDGKLWRFAEPGMGHSKNGAHMTLILSSALDAFLVQQASHKHKGMIAQDSAHSRTGMLLADVSAYFLRATSGYDPRGIEASEYHFPLI